MASESGGEHAPSGKGHRYAWAVTAEPVMDRTHRNNRLGTAIVSGLIAVRVAAALLLLYTITNDLRAWALGVFLFAVVTDALDGYVVRRCGGGPPFLGPYSDAAADFFLVLTAFSAFVLEGVYPLWTLLLIVAMFIQFVLTSRRDRPVYDPVGKYYGLFLFCAVGVTLVVPDPGVCRGVLAGILGFTAASAVSRFVFLLGLWKKRVFQWMRGFD